MTTSARFDVEIVAADAAQLAWATADVGQEDQRRAELRAVLAERRQGVRECVDLALGQRLQSLRPFGVSSRRFVNGLAAISPSRCASANIVRATRVVPFGHCEASRRAVGRSTRASSDVAGVGDDALDCVAVRALRRGGGAGVVAKPDHGPVPNGPCSGGRSDPQRRRTLRVRASTSVRTFRSTADCPERSGRRP